MPIASRRAPRAALLVNAATHPPQPVTPKTPADLFVILQACGIETATHEHPAVFTVAESSSIKAALPGGHSKNLFLKDRRGRLFLVVAKDDTAIDLKRLHDTIGASGRLSFGSGELLRATLGVEPGSVTPFAVINDEGRQVSVVLDEALMALHPVNFHPLVNTATTAISGSDLIAFLRHTGHEPAIRALPPPAVCGNQGATHLNAAP